MRTLIYCFFLFEFSMVANLAVAGEPEIQWNTQLPFSSGSVIWDVEQVGAEGYIGVGEVEMGTSGKTALNITRFNNDGEILWENTALSLGNSVGHSIKPYNDGFIICGVSSDSSHCQGMITRIDQEGNTDWIVSSGYENNDALYDFCINPAGNIIAVGYSFNDETSDNDVFIMSVSPIGELLWKRRFISPAYQTAYAIIPSGVTENEYVITGSDDGNLFLMCLDNDGNWLWKTSHPMNGYQVGQDVCLTSEGQYVVAGVTRPDVGFSDALLVFFNETGDVVKEHVWGTDGPDNAYSIKEIDPAGFVVLMNSNSGTGEGFRPRLCRFDPWLSVIWSIQITNYDALCYSFKMLEDNSFIVCGQSTYSGHETEYSSSVYKLSSEDLFHWE